MTITNKRRYLEAAAVAFTGLGKIWFMDFLNWRFPFIAVVIAGWSWYVIRQSKTNPGILKYWGFRSDNFRRVAMKILPFGLASVSIFLAVGFYCDTINLSWHIFPVLLLYPIWGTIQQFLVIALVAGNLNDLDGRKPKTIVTLIVTALLFGLVHYPDFSLMTGTFILACLYGYIYLTERNVFVMGLFHGWLGGLFFYMVVGRDPFAEVFGKYFQ